MVPRRVGLAYTPTRREWPRDAPTPGAVDHQDRSLMDDATLSPDAHVVNLDGWRRRLPPGPDRCPPWCEWCYGPNRLGGRWTS
jgi:hypothetical protein